MSKIYAQGDILLVNVEKPEGKTTVDANKKAIVGYGEGSGRSHVICAERVDWLVGAVEEINGLHEFAMGQKTMDVFIDVPDGGVINHMKNGHVVDYDHRPIEIEPGTYRVIRQRQATAESIRPILD